VLIEKHDYTGAAAELTAFLKLAPNAPDLAHVKDQLGQVEKLMAASK
jgi:regulator of sirC expression with transglutaminase-like and TPR domain